MDTTASTASRSSARWSAATAPWRQRWLAMAPRERRVATVAAWIIGLALVWFVAVAPAWRSVATATARLDQLDAQLQQMQRMAGEAATLRALPAVGSAQSQAAVKAATDALGGAARLSMAGERATVTFTNVNSTQLREWLAETRSAGRARPVEANLTRGAQGFSGSVVLALPGAPSP
jgi:general secretion pathway protein M